MGDVQKKEEIYVSTDIETNGPIPADYSMLSIGSAAFTKNGKLVDTFTRNLKPLIYAKEHPDTMAWWATQPEAWKEVNTNQKDPTIAMTEYFIWLQKLPGKPVFVGYPAGFDFTFVYWYLMHFCDYSPFGFSCIDIKSYAMAVLKKDFRETSKRNMPRHWFAPGKKHSHIALEDAIEQGILFCNIMKEHNETIK